MSIIDKTGNLAETGFKDCCFLREVNDLLKEGHIKGPSKYIDHLIVSKKLRAIYELLHTYGKFDLEWEGEVRSLGDEVHQWRGGNKCVISHTVPVFKDRKDLHRWMMDTLPWQAGGFLVFTTIGTQVVYGITPYEQGEDDGSK